MADFRLPPLVERVAEIADNLPDALRALDSFQLAPALVRGPEIPPRGPFITAEVRLTKAAENAGFTEILLA